MQRRPRAAELNPRRDYLKARLRQLAPASPLAVPQRYPRSLPRRLEPARRSEADNHIPRSSRPGTSVLINGSRHEASARLAEGAVRPARATADMPGRQRPQSQTRSDAFDTDCEPVHGLSNRSEFKMDRSATAVLGGWQCASAPTPPCPGAARVRRLKKFDSRASQALGVANAPSGPGRPERPALTDQVRRKDGIMPRMPDHSRVISDGR